MAVSARITVGTSPTAIIGADGVKSSGAQGRYLITNRGSAGVDLGDAGVASGAGYELQPGYSVSYDEVEGGDALYGIVASGSCRVDVLKVGL